MKSNIRRDSISGLIEDNDSITKVSLTFNEWWNGEGLDFTFFKANNGEVEKQISLHSDEIKNIMVAALASGFLDLDEVKELSDKIISDSKKHEEEIKNFQKNHNIQIETY
jgi:hypothetical protein